MTANPLIRRMTLFAAQILFFLIILFPGGARSAPYTEAVAIIPSNAPPTYYWDEKKQRAYGFAVEVLNAVADRENIKINYRRADTWDQILAALADGTADVAPGMGISEERKKIVRYTEPIDSFPVSLYVRSEIDAITAPENGITVGALAGSLAYEPLKQNRKINLIAYSGFEQGLFDLLSGRIDAFSSLAPILDKLAEDAGVSHRIKKTGTPIATVTRAIGIRKTNPVLFERLDKATTAFVSSQEYRNIYMKWYGKPPAWTGRKVIIAILAAILVMTLLSALWHYYSLLKLNRELEQSIKERRAAEQKTEKWANVFEHAGWGVCVGSADAKTLELINPTFASMHGYAVEELTGKPVLDVIAPEMRASVAGHIREAHEKNHHAYESLHIKKDGSIFPVRVHVSAVKDGQGNVLYRAVNVEDITERRMIEASLRENEKQLRIIFETSQAGIMLVGPNGKIMLANRRMSEMFGCGLSELIGSPYLDHVESTHRVFSDQRMRQLISGEIKHLTAERRYLRKDGSSLWGLLTTRRLDHADGTLRALIMVIADTTERKEAADALVKLNRAYMALSACNEAVVRITDETELVQAVTRIVQEASAYRMAWIGFAEHDEDGTVRIAASAGSETEYLEQIRISWHNNRHGQGPAGKAIRTGNVTVVKDVYADPDVAPWKAEAVKRGYYSIASIPIRAGDDVSGALTVYASKPDAFEDQEVELLRKLADNLALGISSIRSRKAREQAGSELRGSEERFRLLLESTGEAIFGMDVEGVCTFCNPSGLRLLGYSDQRELLGKPLHKLMHHSRSDGGLYPAVECKMMAAIRQGDGAYVADEVFWRSDGTSFPVEYRSYPQKQNDRIVGAVVTFSDITERLRIEERLREAQKMQAVGTLAGGVAHDFNNIMMAIMGNAELLKMESMPDPVRDLSIEEIINAAKKAAYLTAGLLAFSRKQLMKLKILDLNEIVRETEVVMQSIVSDDVTVQVDLPSEPALILCDREQIEQVLLNLVKNAGEAMPGGGRIRIATSIQELDRSSGITPATSDPGFYAVLTVTDTGHGMKKDVLDRIFEPFFTTKEVGKGTGLGLSMAYGIVRKHEGYITAGSEPKRGTTFMVYLPLEPVGERKKKLLV